MTNLRKYPYVYSQPDRKHNWPQVSCVIGRKRCFSELFMCSLKFFCSVHALPIEKYS